jgi:hypothetical protein
MPNAYAHPPLTPLRRAIARFSLTEHLRPASGTATHDT